MAGVDEALMLDPHGFVATCNSVNFFCVRRGEVRMCENVCVGRREVRTRDKMRVFPSPLSLSLSFPLAAPPPPSP